MSRLAYLCIGTSRITVHNLFLILSFLGDWKFRMTHKGFCKKKNQTFFHFYCQPALIESDLFELHKGFSFCWLVHSQVSKVFCFFAWLMLEACHWLICINASDIEDLFLMCIKWWGNQLCVMHQAAFETSGRNAQGCSGLFASKWFCNSGRLRLYSIIYLTCTWLSNIFGNLFIFTAINLVFP